MTWTVPLTLGISLAGPMNVPTIANTSLANLVDESEVVVVATVESCRAVYWNGPVGDALLHRCRLHVVDAMLGEVATGWVEMPRHTDEGALPPGFEILVFGHTTKLACRVAACADDEHYVSVPPFQDSLIPVVRGAILHRLNDDRVEVLHGTGPEWIAGLDWQGVKDLVASTISARSAEGVSLPGAPASE